ncbi:hypothetical protein KIL84_011728 [Mauremys mutica]|uniref:Uncharacterized protein n=1 Tax=Mauremys mutica TaxID=74926 RepID=A0A9D3XE68_9SAUR|nr:hypothetical protein KIL84_011728 [Mauremys mutica]
MKKNKAAAARMKKCDQTPGPFILLLSFFRGKNILLIAPVKEKHSWSDDYECLPQSTGQELFLIDAVKEKLYCVSRRLSVRTFFSSTFSRKQLNSPATLQKQEKSCSPLDAPELLLETESRLH